MGTIKIEFDVPDFDNELNISVTIKKDGEVVDYTSTASSPSENNAVEPKLVKSKSVKKNVIEKSESKFGGNMMNLNI